MPKKEITKEKITITVDKKNLKIVRDQISNSIPLSSVFDILLQDLARSFDSEINEEEDEKDTFWLLDFLKARNKKEEAGKKT